MTACPQLVYPAVSLAAWAAMKAEVQSRYGVQINAPAGQRSLDGLTVEYNYDGTRLMLECTDSPGWLACGAINGVIDGLVTACLAANPQP